MFLWSWQGDLENLEIIIDGYRRNRAEAESSKARLVRESIVQSNKIRELEELPTPKFPKFPNPKFPDPKFPKFLNSLTLS